LPAKNHCRLGTGRPWLWKQHFSNHVRRAPRKSPGACSRRFSPERLCVTVSSAGREIPGRGKRRFFPPFSTIWRKTIGGHDTRALPPVRLCQREFWRARVPPATRSPPLPISLDMINIERSHVGEAQQRPAAAEDLPIISSVFSSLVLFFFFSARRATDTTRLRLLRARSAARPEWLRPDHSDILDAAGELIFPMLVIIMSWSSSVTSLNADDTTSFVVRRLHRDDAFCRRAIAGDTRPSRCAFAVAAFGQRSEISTAKAENFHAHDLYLQGFEFHARRPRKVPRTPSDATCSSLKRIDCPSFCFLSPSTR